MKITFDHKEVHEVKSLRILDLSNESKKNKKTIDLLVGTLIFGHNFFGYWQI